MKYPRIPYWQLVILPTLLIFLGALLNQIAIAANGGSMPVLMHNCQLTGEAEFMSFGTHICMTSQTHLKILCDWINLHTVIASVGDMFLLLGEGTQTICWVIWAALIVRDENPHES